MASPNDETEGKNKKKMCDSGGIRGKLVSNADVEVMSVLALGGGGWSVILCVRLCIFLCIFIFNFFFGKNEWINGFLGLTVVIKFFISGCVYFLFLFWGLFQ